MDVFGRDLGIVGGLVEGFKLCRVNVEGYVIDYFSFCGGIEVVCQRVLEFVFEFNFVCLLDIFFSVQVVFVKGDKGLFVGMVGEEKVKQDSMVQEEEQNDD